MKFHQKNAQTAIEYMLLLSLVAVIVIVGFSRLLPQANQSVSALFSRASSSIVGETVQPVNGDWCPWSSCACGGLMNASECAAQGAPTTQTRLCDCPAPLGSGAICSGPSQQPCS